MKMSHFSIGARMAGALGLVLALLIGAALFGIAALYKTLGTYDSTVLQRVAQERAVSRMESEFKTQVLEWKNTLLRGEDSRKRELHWNAFQASEKRVADAAKALEPQLSDAQEKAALQKFTQAHAQMAQGYRKGFEVFQSLGFVPSAGDADVADIDSIVAAGQACLNAQGLPVLIGSRCPEGRTRAVYGNDSGAHTLIEAGALLVGDLSPVKARLLLAALLARGVARFAPGGAVEHQQALLGYGQVHLRGLAHNGKFDGW